MRHLLRIPASISVSLTCNEDTLRTFCLLSGFLGTIKHPNTAICLLQNADYTLKRGMQSWHRHYVMIPLMHRLRSLKGLSWTPQTIPGRFFAYHTTQVAHSRKVCNLRYVTSKNHKRAKKVLRSVSALLHGGIKLSTTTRFRVPAVIYDHQKGTYRLDHTPYSGCQSR